jgi:hypothetical protein
VPARNQKTLIVLALVILAVTLVVVVFDKPPAPPPVIILPPGPLAVKTGRVPDRWIPRNWTWLQRACQFVFGPLRQTGFNVQFLASSETVASIVKGNSLGQPQAQSDDLAFWILPHETLPPGEGAATIVAAPMVTTLEQHEAMVGISGSFVNYSARLIARLEKKSADLSAQLVVTSAGQTNFIAAARAQIPYGQALLVLDARQPELATNRMEIVITVDEYDAKGNKVHGTAAGK